MKTNLIFTLISFLLSLLVSSNEEKVYIVYFGAKSENSSHKEIEEYHLSCLFSLKNSIEEAKSSLLYSYTHNINGFAATLTPYQAQKLSVMDEVVSVIPSKLVKMHTTRSWEFLGLRHEENGNVIIKDDVLSQAKSGKQIIVGVLDGGIWPESESFRDEGMDPVPKSWKGICEEGEAFNSSHCNKKIIGARYYLKGFERHNGPLNPTDAYRSARDENGHGTHTSSTVGGRLVHAELRGGFANGTASGGAPLVHLAIYKVCWRYSGCHTADILAAFHDAIRDGVDVLSVSIGGLNKDYASDPIAIGSLHATRNNIVVACSAGNSGHSISSVENGAPWIITVASSSIDRAFRAPLFLGNDVKIMGESMSVKKLKEGMYPLYFPGDMDNFTSDSGHCLPYAISPEKMKGKIVICYDYFLDQRSTVKDAGGVGLIYGNTPTVRGPVSATFDDVFPTISLGANDTQMVLNYINTAKNPTAYFSNGRTFLGVKPAPNMATSSSRGPNSLCRDLLKPDVTAPGVDILAAWTESPFALHPEKYTLESGTSMSCPHVAAVAALLKAIHPTWSAAAIRSALMTTAISTNNMMKPITDINGIKADPYKYGSGHIRPTHAADPGLVYDASYTDYLLFLCSNNGYSLDKSFKCPKNPSSTNNLNYPSLAIWELNETAVTVKRTVTNVGSSSTYICHVDAPEVILVNVSPSRLSFKNAGEKKSFSITVEREKNRKISGANVFGSYSWSDGFHVVRSPIAINLS